LIEFAELLEPHHRLSDSDIVRRIEAASLRAGTDIAQADAA
jgi:hypothetical protein